MQQMRNYDGIIAFLLQKHENGTIDLRKISIFLGILLLIVSIICIRGIHLTITQNNYTYNQFPFVSVFFIIVNLLFLMANVRNYIGPSFGDSIIRQFLHSSPDHIISNIFTYMSQILIEILMINAYGYETTIISLFSLNIFWILSNAIDTHRMYRQGDISLGFSGVTCSSNVFMYLCLVFQFNWINKFWFFGLSGLLYETIYLFSDFIQQAYEIQQKKGLSLQGIERISNTGHLVGHISGIMSYIFYHLYMTMQKQNDQIQKQPIFKPNTAIWKQRTRRTRRSKGTSKMNIQKTQK